MEPEARYTLVGAIVLALALAAGAAWVWLAQGGAGRDFRFYSIRFEQQSLDGLQLGSDVNMRGVKIGRVQDYSISRENINRVDVVVRVDRQTPVSRNTNAVISRNLVTGLARIDLVTPGTPGPELLEVPPGERYPVIPEGTSGLDEIAGALSRLAVTGEAVLKSIEGWLDEKNRTALVGAVGAIGELAKNLDQRLNRIDQVVATLSDSSRAFQNSNRDIAASVARMADEAVRTMSGVAPLTQQAQAALGDLSGAAKALERESAAVMQRLGDNVDTGALELRNTARELRHAAEALSRAADRLREPRAALLGPAPSQLGPGERLP